MPVRCGRRIIFVRRPARQRGRLFGESDEDRPCPDIADATANDPLATQQVTGCEIARTSSGLAVQLAGRQVTVIAPPGSTPVTLAAKAATMH